MEAITSKERRALLRHPGDTIGRIRLRLHNDEFIATVQDITVSGIGILVTQQLQPGDCIVLEPISSTDSWSKELTAEIRHATKVAEKYLVGCRLSRYLTARDMMSL